MTFKTASTHESDPESARASSFVLRALVWVLVLSAIALGLFLVWEWGVQAWQLRTYYREVRHLQQTLEPWRQPPPDADAHVWREVSGLVTQTAVGNVCFSPSHVPLVEVRRLQRDVETEMARGPVSLEKLDWLWQRLAEAGPGSQKYIKQMQPLWDEAKGALQSK